MTAKYVLAALAIAFLVAGVRAFVSQGRPEQGRIWLLVGGIFTFVSLWLFSRR